jgi:hypothetical protein
VGFHERRPLGFRGTTTGRQRHRGRAALQGCVREQDGFPRFITRGHSRASFSDVSLKRGIPLSPPETNNNNCQTLCPYSLSDFFTGNWTNSGAAKFVPITTYAYGSGVFENWGANDGNVPTDPDAYESQ